MGATTIKIIPEPTTPMPPDTYTCATCGQTHAGLPLSFAADFPDPYANLKPDERDRAVVGSDQC